MDEAELDARWEVAQTEILSRLAPGHARYLEAVQEDVHPGYRFPWRVAEAPSVASPDLARLDLERMRALVAPFLQPAFRRRFQEQVPALFRRPPGVGWFPCFLATDFHRVPDPRTGRLRWCVPEIQSFPGNLLLKAHMLRHHLPRLPGVPPGHVYLDPSFATREEAEAHLRAHVVGSADPSEVVIVELDPLRQKTVVDMMLFMKTFGVRLVDLRALEPAEGGAPTYRRGFVWEDGHCVERAFPVPQPARRLLCRALPDEIVPALAHGKLDPERTRRLLASEDGCTWVVHPQDFFVVSKATLADHPECDPPLLAVRAGIEDELERRGFAPQDGFLKPAWAAGGRGLVAAPSAADLRRHAEDYDAALIASADPAEALPRLALWQPCYPTRGLLAPDLPGLLPPAPGGDPREESAPLYCELRIMWTCATDRDGAVSLTPFTGLTRWARVGQPAHASRARTPFTGTQGLLRLPDGW